jgi:aspartate aminotransferase
MQMAISKKIKDALTGASWVRRMFEEGEELKRLYGGENVFDFSLGNPNLEPPRSLKKALKTLADFPITGMHRYMPNSGYSETRLAIAQYSKDSALSTRTMIMTVGAAGGIHFFSTGEATSSLLHGIQGIS